MSKPTQPELVASSLRQLVDLIQPVNAISDHYESDPNRMGEVIMTSMGTRRSAVVTPAYPAFQFENNMFARLDAAATYRRPLIEGGVRFSRGSHVASVILRYCAEPHISDELQVVETSALFNISNAAADVETFEDVVDAITNGVGYSHAGERSGYVLTRNVPHRDGRWQTTVTEAPYITAKAISNAIIDRIAFISL